LSPPVFASPEVFDREITRLSELCDNVEWLNLLGGEPLLHPRVLDFARSARREFPNAGIALITNGLLLRKMPDEFWRSLASLGVQLRVSVYPVSLDVDAITKTAVRYGVDVVLNPIISFRRVPIREQGRCDPTQAFRRCEMCPLLRDGRIYLCAYAGLIGIVASKFGAAAPTVTATDSVSIYDVTDGYEIAQFLKHPVGWCRHCDFDAIERFDWRPSERRLEEWT
jgi:MoaA/NifB/PqqE/SkfB family radical SAM enzyme